MLAEQCGPAVHPATTTAIIKVESGGQPFAIHDNRTNRSYFPQTKIEAQWIAYTLLTRDHSIDMGLMQVNSTHITGMGIDYRELFDPCYNIAVGTRVLGDFYRRYNNSTTSPETALLYALSGYNTGTPYKGRNYVNRILEAAGSAVRVPISSTAQ